MQQYPGLTKQQVEDHFEGSLCRCTGKLIFHLIFSHSTLFKYDILSSSSSSLFKTAENGVKPTGLPMTFFNFQQ